MGDLLKFGMFWRSSLPELPPLSRKVPTTPLIPRLFKLCPPIRFSVRTLVIIVTLVCAYFGGVVQFLPTQPRGESADACDGGGNHGARMDDQRTTASGEVMAKRWRLRLWHLFAVIAMCAIALFIFQHIAVAIVIEPPDDEICERLLWLRVAWDETEIINWSNHQLSDFGMDEHSPRSTFGF